MNNTINSQTTALVPVPKPRTDRAKPEPSNPMMQVLNYLRLHALLILFCGTLLGAVLAYATWTLMPSKYESYAMLLVASSPNSIAMGNDPNRGRTDFATYVKTTTQLIRSDHVLSSALSDPNFQISKLETIQSQKNPVKFLEEKIEIGYSDTSEVIKISFTGDNPTEVRSIVEAVKEAYFREIVEKEIRLKSEFKLKVEKAKTALEAMMKTRTNIPDRTKPGLPVKPTSAIMQAGGVPVPEIPGIAPANPMNPVNPITQAGVVPPNPAASVLGIADSDPVKKARFSALIGRITTYEVDLQKYPLLIKEREGDVEKLKKQIDDLTKLAPTPEALAAAERDPEVAAKMFDAAKQKRDYEYIRSVANNPNSDKIQRQKADADKAEMEANKLKTEKAALLDGQRNRDKSDRLIQQYDAAERDLRRLKESEQIAKKMFEDAKKELSELPPEMRKEDEKMAMFDPERTDLQSHDDMYKRIATQLIGLDFELQSPPRVRRFQDASLPSAKDPKKQIIMTVVAGFLGFGLMGLGAVGYEARAKKVSSLADLKSVGTTPVLGVVPWQPNAVTANDPLKKADVTDAIDKLRSVVAQTWLTKGIRTIAISSPFADEGKAFTAFGLANSLAQAGYRTLLIDFDLRNPSLHQFAGVPNADGVCEMLRGECDPRAGQILLPSGLSLLPAGKWTDEMRRSAVGARLEFLLSEVRENFECVLLHGHGLLSVAESIEIVRRSDAVIICTLYRETRMPLLKRSIERLSTLEVTTSGIVYIGASPQESLC